MVFEERANWGEQILKRFYVVATSQSFLYLGRKRKQIISYPAFGNLHFH